MPVDALDTLVHAFIFGMWALFAAAFVTGAVLLHRHNAGLHHSDAQAVDVGHQPTHARPARPSLAARVLDDYLTSVRELATARALLTGGAQPW